MFPRLLLVCLTAMVAGCANHTTGAASGASSVDRTLILVSFDGFRWDYPDRGASPNLNALARRGVRAEGLIPSFPTKTFPNHYTLVTGLVPDHHGIVSNTMYDPDFDAVFSLSRREAVQDGRWWGGEPVWITAEKSGLVTAPFFWPGSEAEINGTRPSYWHPFDGSVPNAVRVQWVLDLLDLPAGQRPAFLTLYADDTDAVGHDAGPESPEILEAIEAVDDALGLLLEGVDDRGLTDQVNIVVVSDHGMIPTSRDRVIFVDDYVDLATARPVDWNPVLALWPAEADVPEVYAALHGAHPHLAVFLRDSVPARFEYGTNPRTPPVIGIADPGWTISNHPYYNEDPSRADGGNHGFDQDATGMQGIFVAAGPAFRSGIRVPAFRNVDVYPLLMRALDLPEAAGDGRIDRVPGILAAE